MTSKNWREGVVLLLLSIIAGGVVIIAYLSLFHVNPPIEFLNAPFPVLEEVVTSGGRLSFEVEQCRYTEAPVTIYRSWHDGLVFSEPARTISGSDPGCLTETVSVKVPADLPAGTYTLHNRLVYRVNPFAYRVVDGDTMPFVVVADE